MKRNILWVIAIVMLIVALISCGPDGGPAPNDADVQLEKLATTWKCTEAIRDAVPQVGYDTFRLIVSGTAGATEFGYACSGRPSLSPWPSGGTWKFGTNVLTDILRDSDLPMNYSLSSDGSLLELNFTYQGAGNGRQEEVKGQWRFRFSK